MTRSNSKNDPGQPWVKISGTADRDGDGKWNK